MAHTNLGAALSSKGRTQEAIANYRRVVELDPKWGGSHYNLGCALSKSDQIDEAIAAYRKAIEVDPKFIGAYYNLGKSLQKKKALDEAIVAYRSQRPFRIADEVLRVRGIGRTALRRMRPHIRVEKEVHPSPSR